MVGERARRDGRAGMIAMTAAALAAGGIWSGGPASAVGGECTPIAHSPRVVVLGLSAVNTRFAVSTDCPDPVAWTLAIGGVGVSVSEAGPVHRFDPSLLDNADRGAHDVSATATDAMAVTNEAAFAGSFTLKRRTSLRSFNAAPEPAVRGRRIRLSGRLVLADWEAGAYTGYAGQRVRVQFKPAGGAYSTLRGLTTGAGGRFSVTVTARRSGSWRLHFPGSALVGAATTAGDGVTVLPTSPTRRFARCADLHRYYPHGVGRSGARDLVRGSTRPVTNFTVSTTLYRANESRDRDRDGVACERH